MLSAYNLACGYVQRFENGNFRVSLWKEHNAYHVRSHEFNGRGRIAWEVFSSLAQARKSFISLKRKG
jgi:hypothetical protein